MPQKVRKKTKLYYYDCVKGEAAVKKFLSTRVYCLILYELDFFMNCLVVLVLVAINRVRS